MKVGVGFSRLLALLRMILRFVAKSDGHRPRRVTLVLGTLALAIVSACSTQDGDTSTDAAPDSISVAAAFYPIAEAAEAIGGECVEVQNLTPPGAEPHDLELTPEVVESIASAEVVLFVGSGFQPSVQDALSEASGTTLDVLTVVETVPASPSEGSIADPHVWLDPGLWAQVMPEIARAMNVAAPDAGCDFGANARRYSDDLAALDRAFSGGLRDCGTDLIVTNHSAFGYLAAAYGLRQESISGLQPDAEPTPQHIADLAELVRASGVTTIFSEELVSPEVAQTLAEEAGVQTATLNTIEGLTPQEIDAGESYDSVMRTNLETLRSALACP